MTGQRYAALRARHGSALLMLVALAACAACTPVNPYYDSAKRHHTPEGFRNTADTSGRTTGDFLRWQRERWQLEVPAPRLDLSVVAPDLAFIQNNRTHFAATYIGHATVLVQLGGLNIVTDPHFSQRAFPVQFVGPRRWQPPGVPLADLPHIDIVVVSHNHYDHLDKDSVVALNGQAGGAPLFVVPLGLERWMQGVGVANVKALDWWQQVAVGDVTITLVPAQHWSRRTLTDRNESLWGGFVGQTGPRPGSSEAVAPAVRSFYFAGDTGYGPDFAAIGERFGNIDLALIPIGAYEPRWFMSEQHVNPDEAMQIHRDVRARRSVGIHWGTFLLTDEPLDQPLADLAVARDKAGISATEFMTLRHGQTLNLDDERKQ